MGVPLGVKSTFPSNISSFKNGLSERSIFNVGRVEVFVPFISSKPGDQTLPKLLFCSSNSLDEKHLSLFLCGSHHLVCVIHE